MTSHTFKETTMQAKIHFVYKTPDLELIHVSALVYLSQEPTPDDVQALWVAGDLPITMADVDEGLRQDLMRAITAQYNTHAKTII